VARDVTTRVLIVEDERSFVDALTVALTREGLEVEAAMDGRQGVEAFRRGSPDVVLLDLMLPGMAGLDVLRLIRASSSVPVIVVSAKDAEADVVAALELGADDYITKPYSVRELVARIRAAVRRSSPPATGEVLVAGSARLDLGTMQFTLGTSVAALPKKELEVLEMLMEHPGRVVTREEFLDRVWGYTWMGETRTLDQHIRRLRRRLEQDPGAPYIETVRGVGYRLVTRDP
jgi:two-component system, OmpR family, response regulator RegX3